MKPPGPHGRGSHLDPPNRFTLRVVERDLDELSDDALDALRRRPTKYVIDRAVSVVSENDSPDIPFRYSLNPYRGCIHGCAYCLSGETPILMADGTARPLSGLAVGDEIFGTVLVGQYRRYTPTKVLAHWRTLRAAYRVRLRDGTELVASGDHRFLSERGWKHVARAEIGQRPYLTPNNRLLGTGRIAAGPAKTTEYERGYLTGLIRGDGFLRSYDYGGVRRATEMQYHFRLALRDRDALGRAAEYLHGAGIETYAFQFQGATETRAEMPAIRNHSRAGFERITETIRWPESPDLEWKKGYLAGLFDAEGSFSGSLRFHNSDGRILRFAEECLSALGFSFVYDVDKKPANLVVRTLRVCGGLREHLRFFHTVDNATLRKRNISGVALKSDADTVVVSVDPLGIELPMYDITTGTGDFIANGIVSHNCYARPTHEYLGLNAGLDFESVILVKEDAPALFRDWLTRPKYVPESVTLSGVTDPYQPVERERRLTRACLEVALEARQPLSLITKNALVLRDLDLLRQMAEMDLVHVTVAVTSLDAALARSMEPRTTTPEARLRAVRELSAAGVPVRVLIAPVVPGLTDEEMPAILEAAKQAGAAAASYTLLRLPGVVEEVFFEWLRREQPGRAEKVESRIRSTRGGRLSDARFGRRMSGEGPMARQISQLFELFARRLGLTGDLPAYDVSRFRPPKSASGQGWLF